MSQLFSPGPLKRVVLDLTTKCNLRCVYCALSQAGWQGVDMPDDVASLATSAIMDISQHQHLDEVHVNGHGETTFLAGWDKICRSLLEQNLPLTLTTNLAKEYSEPELEVMARMKLIAVSIDSCDPDLVKRMRRKVDVRQIVMNIQMIRATALRLGDAPPSFGFSCGLYDQNSLHIENFARFAVALGVTSVGFWNLTTWHHDKFPYENTDVPASDHAYPLDELSPEELRPRLDAIQTAIAILSTNGVTVEINGNFIETLINQCKTDSKQEIALNATEMTSGMTRDCLDPWTYAELDTNGDVKPCCARGGIGNLGRSSLLEILNDEPIRQLRASLLSGHIDRECAECTLKPPIRPEVLQETVRNLLEGTDSGESGWQPVASTTVSGKVTNLLNFAVFHMRAGRKAIAWNHVAQALAMDPGITIASPGDGMIQSCLPTILANTRTGSTLSVLAAICREAGDRQSGLTLLRRYLELAPGAPDRQHVLADIAAETPPKQSTGAALENLWIQLRRKVRLRSRVRLAIAILRRR